MEVGQTKYYNNRPVVLLRNEGSGFWFVISSFDITHEITGSNFCTMCMAGGDFISTHTCIDAGEVIDHVMENIEDKEVFWVSELYLKDHPFEYKKNQDLLNQIDALEIKKRDLLDQISFHESNKNSIMSDIELKQTELNDIQLRTIDAQHKLMSAESEKPHKEIPDILSTGLIEISASELRSLFEDKVKLRLLENGGLDNWEWYSESIGETDIEAEALKELSVRIK